MTYCYFGFILQETGMMPTTDILKDSLRWLFTILVSVGILVNLATIYILYRCKRIAKTIRMGFFHILIFETLPLINHVLFECFKESPKWRIQLFRLDKYYIFVTWTMTTLLAMERVFILESPRLYMRYITNYSIAIICGVLWATITAGVLIPVFSGFDETSLQKTCRFGISLNLFYCQ